MCLTECKYLGVIFIRCKLLFLMVAISAFAIGQNVKTVFAETKMVVARNEEANVVLYANEIDKKHGLYRDFEMKIDGGTKRFPYWINVTNPTYAPTILYSDLNKDKKKDNVVVLTKGYGSGALDSEVHVLNNTKTNIGEIFVEVLVDNPMAIILKNVNTELTQDEAVISIGNKKTVINIEKFHIPKKHLFNDVGFGSIVKFDVVNNHLVATVSGQITPAMFIGEIEITYEFKDKMYQAKKIEFRKSL